MRWLRRRFLLRRSRQDVRLAPLRPRGQGGDAGDGAGHQEGVREHSRRGQWYSMLLGKENYVVKGNPCLGHVLQLFLVRLTKLSSHYGEESGFYARNKGNLNGWPQKIWFCLFHFDVVMYKLC